MNSRFGTAWAVGVPVGAIVPLAVVPLALTAIGSRVAALVALVIAVGACLVDASTLPAAPRAVVALPHRRVFRVGDTVALPLVSSESYKWLVAELDGLPLTMEHGALVGTLTGRGRFYRVTIEGYALGALGIVRRPVTITHNFQLPLTVGPTASAGIRSARVRSNAPETVAFESFQIGPIELGNPLGRVNWARPNQTPLAGILQSVPNTVIVYDPRARDIESEFSSAYTQAVQAIANGANVSLRARSEPVAQLVNSSDDVADILSQPPSALPEQPSVKRLSVSGPEAYAVWGVLGAWLLIGPSVDIIAFGLTIAAVGRQSVRAIGRRWSGGTYYFAGWQRPATVTLTCVAALAGLALIIGPSPAEFSDGIGLASSPSAERELELLTVGAATGFAFCALSLAFLMKRATSTFRFSSTRPVDRLLEVAERRLPPGAPPPTVRTALRLAEELTGTSTDRLVREIEEALYHEACPQEISFEASIELRRLWRQLQRVDPRCSAPRDADPANHLDHSHRTNEKGSSQ